MRGNLRSRTHAGGAVLMAAALCLAATPAMEAAEQVTLRNGYELVCDHRALVDGRVRIYLQASDDNYLELRPEEIASVATIPEQSGPKVEAVAAMPAKPAIAATEGKMRASLSALDLRQLLADAGQTHNLDEDLLASVVKAESGGNARAVSRAGAAGLMQLMPGTATEMGVADRFEPRQNVSGGTAYLDALLTRYHDNLSLALAAYNAGPAAVDKYRGVPPYPETRAYVARVIHEFNRRVKARREEENRQKRSFMASAIASGR